MSSAVITPASLPSSSTTGKVSRLYLSNSSVTRSCLIVDGHLDQRLGGQVLELGIARGEEQPRQRDGGHQLLVAIHQEERIQAVQQVFVALEGGQGVGHGGVFVKRHVLRVHHAAGRVLFELQQLAHFGLGLGLHFVENLFGGLLFQLGEDVGGLVGRHLFDDVGGLFRLQGFQDAGLHLGILDFGQRIGGRFAVDGFEDGLALGRAQVFDDVGQVGRVHLLQLLVGDIQPQAAQRIGLDHIGEFPADGIGRDGLLQPPDPAAAAARPGTGGGKCCARRYRRPPRRGYRAGRR